MNAPGWQQQQPPPGWQQQPGWGYPPPPRKKSKAPIIITLVIFGVLLLGGGGTAAFFYFEAHEAKGSAPTGDKLPEPCGKVSEATLAKARTTNPNGKMAHHLELNGRATTTCDWRQTKGKDGEGLRSLTVHIEQSEDPGEAFGRLVEQAKLNNQGEIQVKELDLGDQSTAVLMTTKSAFTTVDVVVRKDDTVYEVDYAGWDVGLFSPKQPDLAQLEATAKSVAEELLR